MQFPVSDWYNAIFLRHSCRNFTDGKPEQEVFNHLIDFTHGLNGLAEGARVVLVTENPDRVFKGLIGSYGRVKGAPAYAAFIGDTRSPDVQEKVGYVGECFILEAVARGLDTCWVAGFLDREVVKQHITMSDYEKVFAVTPVGYVISSPGAEDKTMSRDVSGHKRKELRSLCRGISQECWPEWVKNSLGAARLAPSAINRQPWRFLVEEASITVSVDSTFLEFGVSKRLDCGIAMLHLEIGALRAGVRGDWETLSSPGVAKFKLRPE